MRDSRLRNTSQIPGQSLQLYHRSLTKSSKSDTWVPPRTLSNSPTTISLSLRPDTIVVLNHKNRRTCTNHFNRRDTISTGVSTSRALTVSRDGSKSMIKGMNIELSALIRPHFIRDPTTGLLPLLCLYSAIPCKALFTEKLRASCFEYSFEIKYI